MPFRVAEVVAPLAAVKSLPYAPWSVPPAPPRGLGYEDLRNSGLLEDGDGRQARDVGGGGGGGEGWGFQVTCDDEGEGRTGELPFFRFTLFKDTLY